jgi:hypothetical protein
LARLTGTRADHHHDAGTTGECWATLDFPVHHRE